MKNLKLRQIIKEILNEAVWEGDTYTNGKQIEVVISNFRSEKWNTIEYDINQNQISSVGTSPEHLLTMSGMKKKEISNSMKKKIIKASEIALKDDEGIFRDSYIQIGDVRSALK